MALINLRGWPEKLILLTSCRYTTRNRLMTIRDKYFGWKDIFFDRFVHCCNEKSDQPQGSNIPLAKINFDNKTGYVEDGTINIAELLQYLWINNKVYGCEYAPIDISSVLQTLIRLTENAKHMFEDQPGVYDMIPYRGFFLRDDFHPGKIIHLIWIK